MLLITLDALRQDHLSFNGYDRQTSPNIDWLAERGTVFRSMAPTGCSTKASLRSLYVSQGYRRHQIMHGGAKIAALACGQGLYACGHRGHLTNE